MTQGLIEENHQPLNASNLEYCTAIPTLAKSAAKRKQYPMCMG